MKPITISVLTLALLILTACQPKSDSKEVLNAGSFSQMNEEKVSAPEIDQMGLGCDDGTCIWIRGRGFGEDCEIRFYDAAWVSSSPLASVHTTCNSSLASAKIPDLVLENQNNVYVSIFDGKKKTWSRPSSFNVSEQLTGTALGIGDPITPKFIIRYENLRKIGASIEDAFTTARSEQEMQIQKILLLKPKSFRMWIDSRDLDPSAEDYNSHLMLYKSVIRRLNAAGVEIIAMDQMTTGPKWVNHALAPGLQWWTLTVPCPSSSQYTEYLKKNWMFWYRLAQQFPEIKKWEVGNETDGDLFLLPNADALASHCEKAPASQFDLQQKAAITADMMYIARTAIKEVIGDALIFFPGMTGFRFAAEHNIEFMTFAKNRLAAIGKSPRNAYDGIAWHPYWYPSSFAVNNRKIIDYLKASGDALTPIWLTEFGFRRDEFLKTEKEVADATRSVLNQIQNALPEIQAALVYRGFRSADGFGLLESDGTRTLMASEFCQSNDCQEETVRRQRQSLRGLFRDSKGFVWSNGTSACRYISYDHARISTGLDPFARPSITRLPSYIVIQSTCVQ